MADLMRDRQTNNRRTTWRQQSCYSWLLLLMLLTAWLFMLTRLNLDAYLPPVKQHYSYAAAAAAAATSKGTQNSSQLQLRNVNTTVIQETNSATKSTQNATTSSGIVTATILMLQNDSNKKNSFHESSSAVSTRDSVDNFYNQGKTQRATPPSHHVHNETTTTTTQTKNLWFCGWDNRVLAQHLFPDYTPRGTFRIQNSINTTTTTPSDVLLFGLHGPCELNGRSPRALLHDSVFQGRVLFFNGEPFGLMKDLQNTRAYQLGGPIPTHQAYPQDPISHWFPFYFGVVYFLSQPSHWPKLLDPSQRPHYNNNNISNDTSASSKLIYVSSNCLSHRQHVVEKLSTLLPVDTGAKCTIPTATQVTLPDRYGQWKNNWKFYSNYKYCVSMENSKLDGYITEKLFLSFLAGCLPIYWGTEQVLDVFNPDAFLYVWDTTTTTSDNNTNGSAVPDRYDILERIAYLESNHSAYEEMLRAPIFKNVNQSLNQYFSVSDQLGDGSLKRSIRTMMGLVD